MENLENLVEVIRIAIAADAAPIARRAGAVACRKVLAALESPTDSGGPAAMTGDPAATPPPEPPGSPPPTNVANVGDPAALGALLAGMRALPPEQMLDAAIEWLRTKVPASVPLRGTANANPLTRGQRPLQFHLVPIAQLEQRK